MKTKKYIATLKKKSSICFKKKKILIWIKHKQKGQQIELRGELRGHLPYDPSSQMLNGVYRLNSIRQIIVVVS